MVLGLCLLLISGTGLTFNNTASAQSTSDAILHPMELEKLVPKTVFFRGQSAPVQIRNAGGVKFTDGMYFFATLVDTSGYSTGVQAKYQAYLVTEVPILIGTEHLAAGAYGVGFIADNKFLVMDLGAHDLFTVADVRDDQLKRPTPLQVMKGAKDGEYRLYEGKTYVTFSRVTQ
jgi:hypothetical protein